MIISQGKLNHQSLAGKVAIVTGAGGAIGFEAARALLWLGARTVIAELSPKSGTHAERSLNNEFGEGSAIFVKTDVGDERSVQSLQKKAIKEFGKVDTVINNATVAPLGAVQDLAIVRGWQADVEHLSNIIQTD